jgi:predicted phage terminase large subunit-like protein
VSYILDVERGQWEPADRDARIVAATQRDAKRFGDRYTVYGEQEPAASGKDSAIAFRRMVAKASPGVKVFTLPNSGSKAVRADPLAAEVNADRVRMVRGSWNAVLRREFLDFPNGQHDDIVDGVACAHARVTRGKDAPTTIAPSISRRY